MISIDQHQQAIATQGFTVIENMLTPTQCEVVAHAINIANNASPAFRQTNDLFAIRQLLREIPGLQGLVFTPVLQNTLRALFGEGFFVVKSIYFDKSGTSNWFVSYHQDLTISVNKKMNVPGFGPWTLKQGYYAVQPPLAILENNFTVRIHLDDTDAQNGALRVIPGSHRKGIYRPENIDWQEEVETVCGVPQGGMMVMRPLLLHASSRTTNGRPRRVVHIEYSAQQLPAPLQWSEQLTTL
ncbi:Phytanoyl-CoA dioxygenase (PhyH) [Chitinophaga costaii]|uniref:Phytanoyl-CoA dioxygenase (PhyH) n=1 Tax=Chitinophaga costaii TaxID=1335309 RepID=A0A1C4FW30_9BACT|nr:phytanoyl-CoA dioxygenase family protein [Chitinophaga costaii]PUZ27268.1 phytanoyl-CoA dioxygenase [Chitinophaga costaii]SCC60138.1 Phytanoyl-CoA dioxygenase (PhyH) [Chitinophaga costaii]